MPFLVLILLFFPSFASAQPATTELKQHAFALNKVSPAALRALQRMLPASLKSVRWIYRLDGVAGPMVSVRLGGKDYLGGFVCQPHDCGDNEFAYVVARDGTRAVGLVRSTNVRGAGNLVVGSPTPDERALLEELLK